MYIVENVVKLQIQSKKFNLYQFELTPYFTLESQSGFRNIFNAGSSLG